MQKRTARDDQELVEVQSTWTEQERAERRLMAQLKFDVASSADSFERCGQRPAQSS